MTYLQLTKSRAFNVKLSTPALLNAQTETLSSGTAEKCQYLPEAKQLPSIGPYNPTDDFAILHHVFTTPHRLRFQGVQGCGASPVCMGKEGSMGSAVRFLYWILNLSLFWC